MARSDTATPTSDSPAPGATCQGGRRACRSGARARQQALRKESDARARESTHACPLSRSRHGHLQEARHAAYRANPGSSCDGGRAATGRQQARRAMEASGDRRRSKIVRLLLHHEHKLQGQRHVARDIRERAAHNAVMTDAGAFVDVGTRSRNDRREGKEREQRDTPTPAPAPGRVTGMLVRNWSCHRSSGQREVGPILQEKSSLEKISFGEPRQYGRPTYIRAPHVACAKKTHANVAQFQRARDCRMQRLHADRRARTREGQGAALPQRSIQRHLFGCIKIERLSISAN
jgi:hypothetical protein